MSLLTSAIDLINHSSNWIIYALTFKQFRKDCLELLYIPFQKLKLLFQARAADQRRNPPRNS